MFVVIAASTAALLGTSAEQGQDDPPPGGAYSFQTTYVFERKNIDGGGIDLTADQPRATFYVTVRADALGPDDVVTTNSASVAIDGRVTISELNPGAEKQYVTFFVSTPSSPGGTTLQVNDHYSQTQALTFTGNCSAPTIGDACSATFALEVSRNDDGAGGGKVHVDWHFDARSQGVVPSSTEDSQIGPSDPPWTIEVTR
jgi:hypothetical protein